MWFRLMMRIVIRIKIIIIAGVGICVVFVIC